MKYEAIEEYSSIFDVRKMCKALGLDASNYHRWKKQRERRQVVRDKELDEIRRIEKAFIDSNRTYGYRKINA